MSFINYSQQFMNRFRTSDYVEIKDKDDDDNNILSRPILSSTFWNSLLHFMEFGEISNMSFIKLLCGIDNMDPYLRFYIYNLNKVPANFHDLQPVFKSYNINLRIGKCSITPNAEPCDVILVETDKITLIHPLSKTITEKQKQYRVDTRYYRCRGFPNRFVEYNHNIYWKFLFW